MEAVGILFIFLAVVGIILIITVNKKKKTS